MDPEKLNTGMLRIRADLEPLDKTQLKSYPPHLILNPGLDIVELAVCDLGLLVDLLGKALQLLQPGDLLVNHVISLLQQTEINVYLPVLRSGGSVCFWASRIRIRLYEVQIRLRLQILLSSRKSSKKNLDSYFFVTYGTSEK